MLYVLAIYESPEAFDARTGEDQERLTWAPGRLMPRP